MHCPKCGFEQPQSPECRACGIIIEKYLNRSAKTPVTEPQASGTSRTMSPKMSLSMIGVLAAIIIVFIYTGVSWWKNRPMDQPAGIVAADPPEQTETNALPFRFGDYNIVPMADFRIKARVLSKKRYYFGGGSDLVPVDLALGWGPMSDSTVLDKINIRQSNRFYFWSVKEFPIPRNEIETHSANMHLIPSGKSMSRQIKSARTGAVVELSGHLVKVYGPDGFIWNSSLSRTDTGRGACELVFVKTFTTR